MTLALMLGLVLLLAGGAALVKGAAGIATQFGISPMIVGLTIVSFGTSAPELFVNVIGALNDQTELAFGNVVGSNLANLGLVLGIAAIVRPISIDGKLVLRELPLLLLVTGIILVMAADPQLRGVICHAGSFRCADPVDGVRAVPLCHRAGCAAATVD